MEERRRVILILLLVTLSSVKAIDYIFTKTAYKKILEIERIAYGETLQLAGNLTFDGIQGFPNDYEDLVIASADQVEEGNYEGVILVPFNQGEVEAALTNPDTQSGAPEFLWQVSFIFRAIEHDEGITVFGTFTLCFDDLTGQNSHQTYFRAHMFSAPQTERDILYSRNIVMNLNPISQEHISLVGPENSIRWRLETLRNLLSSGVRKVQSQRHGPRETIYKLKPMIVDLPLLQQYYWKAYPQGEIRHMGLPADWQNVASHLFQREIGDLQPRLRRRRVNWLL